ncbi:MAG TPA: Glu/Leu/Phe/Val dehydrogenase dimerization domain-containing protein, partial [Candidatus Lustribacter sp.]|nr:Glu/Leu/Phe/Val dehydrogenase dimerization domain-containing protein [Candidatus Lustribacter sp.]
MTPGTSTPSPTPRPDPTADLLGAAEHELVAVCHDRDTGLRAIIALHSTALGPGLGGTRFYPYPSFAAALTDVLALSKAMSYKNALAGLDHGGGKAVIIGNPVTEKAPELLRAYGRFVESLGGRYVTACDVGTYVADMDVIGEATRFATGRSVARGGAGDSSVLTAYGVFEGMRAAAQQAWGTPTLAGRRVGIAGVGKVGRLLAAHLLDDGADVVVTDVSPAATQSLTQRFPQVEVAPDVATLCAMAIDVYSPCALGGALDPATVESLQARIVCGGANNQLAVDGPDGTADRLQERG